MSFFIIHSLRVSNSFHQQHSFIFTRTHKIELITSSVSLLLRKVDMSFDPKPLLSLWHSISILTNTPYQKKNFRLHHDNFPNANEILYITKSSHTIIILHRTASRHSIKLSLAAFFLYVHENLSKKLARWLGMTAESQPYYSNKTVTKQA
jgi:hypothetical protein